MAELELRPTVSGSGGFDQRLKQAKTRQDVLRALRDHENPMPYQWSIGWGETYRPVNWVLYSDSSAWR